MTPFIEIRWISFHYLYIITSDKHLPKDINFYQEKDRNFVIIKNQKGQRFGSLRGKNSRKGELKK